MGPHKTDSQLIESELSLLDMALFLQGSWKKLVIAAVVGAGLGFTGWLAFGTYKAEIILINNGGIEPTSWRNLQRTLPSLASKILHIKKIPEEKISIYRQMSNEQWWRVNSIPVYSITKSDLKEVVERPSAEEMPATNQILSIVMSDTSRYHEIAIANVIEATHFFISGSSYLTIKKWLKDLEALSFKSNAVVAKKISDTEIELRYQQQRLNGLEVLFKRFPGDPKVSMQVTDPGESSIKYLPLTTQIVALNAEIAANKEILQRLQDQGAVLILQKQFIDQAIVLLGETVDGIGLNANLLDLESALRAKVRPEDIKSINYLDGIRSILLGYKAQFSIGLVENTPALAIKRGLIGFIAVGSISTFLLMTLIILGKRAWPSLKIGDSS